MPSIQKHGPLVILGGAIIWASMVIGYLATHPEPKQKINTDSIFKAGMEQGKKQVLDSIAKTKARKTSYLLIPAQMRNQACTARFPAANLRLAMRQ